MPRTKTATLSPIKDEAFGNYAITDHSERIYAKVYYAIRERQGFIARRSMDNFTWDDFKTKFAEVFGTPEERKYTLEQLLAYAKQKFGMSQDDLIEANQRSWQRRRDWENQTAYQTAQAQRETEMMTDDIPY